MDAKAVLITLTMFLVLVSPTNVNAVIFGRFPDRYRSNDWLLSHYLNLSGTNANQNINVSPYNFEANNITAKGYVLGQPLEGYLGSGIIWADEVDENGNLNVSLISGLDVSYPAFTIRLVKTDNTVKYCDIPSGSVTVPDDTHSVYYIDNDCNVQHTSIQNYITTDLSPGGIADFFNVISHTGTIDILEGSGLQNKEDIKIRKNTFKLTSLDVVSGMGLTQQEFPNITISNGEYSYINEIFTTTTQNTSDGDTIEFIYRQSGVWQYDERYGLNLTWCDDGTDSAACSNPTKYRRYFIGLIGRNDTTDTTKLHQLAASETEIYPNLAGCLDIVTNPVTFDLPANYEYGFVLLYAYCGRASDSDWTGGFIDLRTTTTEVATGVPDLSIFLTRDGSRTLTDNWNVGGFNITGIDFMNSSHAVITDGTDTVTLIDSTNNRGMTVTTTTGNTAARFDDGIRYVELATGATEYAAYFDDGGNTVEILGPCGETICTTGGILAYYLTDGVTTLTPGYPWSLDADFDLQGNTLFAGSISDWGATLTMNQYPWTLDTGFQAEELFAVNDLNVGGDTYSTGGYFTGNVTAEWFNGNWNGSSSLNSSMKDYVDGQDTSYNNSVTDWANSSFVPYTGASSDLDMGSYSVSAEQLTSTDDINMSGVLTNTLSASDNVGLRIDGVTNPYTGTSNLQLMDIDVKVETAASSMPVNAYGTDFVIENDHVMSGSPTSIIQTSIGRSNTVNLYADHTATPIVVFREEGIGMMNKVTADRIIRGGSSIISEENLYGMKNDVSSRTIFNNSAKKLNVNVYGMYNQPNTDGVGVIAGTLNINTYGVYNRIYGGTGGTSKAYGDYVVFTKLADTNYAFYSATSGVDYSFWSAGGDVELADGNIATTGNLDVDGTATIGTLTYTSSDPELLTFYPITLDRAVELIEMTTPQDRFGGVSLYYDSDAKELRMIDHQTGEVRRFTTETVDRVRLKLRTKSRKKYKFDPLTGNITQISVPEPKYRIRKGFGLDRKTGKLYNLTNMKEVGKEAIEEY